jgi:hypothetical protein
VFLLDAADELGLTARATVINRQFAEVPPGDWQFVTARALDKFSERLPRLIKWAGARPMLLFGGENLRAALTQERQQFSSHLMPLSEQRYLFVTEPANRG